MKVYVFQQNVTKMKPDISAQQSEMYVLPVHLVDNVVQVLKSVFMTNFYKLLHVVALDVYPVDVQNFKMYVFLDFNNKFYAFIEKSKIQFLLCAHCIMHIASDCRFFEKKILTEKTHFDSLLSGNCDIIFTQSLIKFRHFCIY